MPLVIESARTQAMCRCWTCGNILSRNVCLVAPVQENDFTEQKRMQAGPAQIGKDQFEWLPEEKTYRCPQGHRLLDYKGNERKQRRDDNTVVQHRYHCRRNTAVPAPCVSGVSRIPTRGGP